MKSTQGRLSQWTYLHFYFAEIWAESIFLHEETHEPSFALHSTALRPQLFYSGQITKLYLLRPFLSQLLFKLRRKLMKTDPGVPESVFNIGELCSNLCTKCRHNYAGITLFFRTKCYRLCREFIIMLQLCREFIIDAHVDCCVVHTISLKIQ